MARSYASAPHIKVYFTFVWETATVNATSVECSYTYTYVDIPCIGIYISLFATKFPICWHSDFDPQAPLTLFGLDGRYATALYTAAARESQLEAVEKELKQVQAVVAKDKNVQTLLDNPTINRSTKKAGVQQLLKAGKYSKITSNFFEVLAENGRLAETQKVIAAYQELMSAHRNELSVVITSAKVCKVLITKYMYTRHFLMLYIIV